jgi:hypothetical protein
MAKVATRRPRSASKSSLKFPVTDQAREFNRRRKRSWAEHYSHSRALPKKASRKRQREGGERDQAARAEYEPWVRDYLSRFYRQYPGGGDWHEPKPLKSLTDIVELAVAGLDNVAASRALSVAICRAAGLKII